MQFVKIMKVYNMPSYFDKKKRHLFSKEYVYKDAFTEQIIAETDDELKQYALTQYKTTQITLNLDNVLYFYEEKNCFNDFIVAKLVNGQILYFYATGENFITLKLWHN